MFVSIHSSHDFLQCSIFCRQVSKVDFFLFFLFFLYIYFSPAVLVLRMDVRQSIFMSGIKRALNNVLCFSIL